MMFNNDQRKGEFVHGNTYVIKSAQNGKALTINLSSDNMLSQNKFEPFKGDFVDGMYYIIASAKSKLALTVNFDTSNNIPNSTDFSFVRLHKLLGDKTQQFKAVSVKGRKGFLLQSRYNQQQVLHYHKSYG